MLDAMLRHVASSGDRSPHAVIKRRRAHQRQGGRLSGPSGRFGRSGPDDTQMGGAHSGIPSSRARCNGAEQTVLLAIRAGGEKHFVGTKITAGSVAAANTKAPQPVDDDCLPVGVSHLVDKLAGSRIVGVDLAVTEVAN